MGNSKNKIAKTATQALVVLWELRLFQSWRDKAAIEARLAKMGHHFSDPEIGMALKRAKHLTRKGKRGSYVYIQKYPYVDEEAAAPIKKKEK